MPSQPSPASSPPKKRRERKKEGGGGSRARDLVDRLPERGAALSMTLSVPGDAPRPEHDASGEHFERRKGGEGEGKGKRDGRSRAMLEESLRAVSTLI